jgi:hypothetical protein
MVGKSVMVNQTAISGRKRTLRPVIIVDQPVAGQSPHQRAAKAGLAPLSGEE